MKIRPLALLCCLALCLSGPAHAQQGSYRERVKDLEDQVAKLTATIKALQQELQMLRIEIRSVRDNGAKATDASSPDEDEAAEDSGDQSWLIRVASNPPPDTADLERQLTAQRTRQSTIDTRLVLARQRYQEVSELEHVWSGKYVGYKAKKRYSQTAINDAKEAVGKLEQEKQAVVAAIARFEKRIATVKNIRIVTGETDDGRPVQIKAKGSLVHVASDLRVGQWYRVVGSARETGDITYIGLRSAFPEPPKDEPQ